MISILPVYKNMNITFGELCHALTNLLFLETESESGKDIQFVHPSGSKVNLKSRGPEKPIWKDSFAEISKQLVDFGITKHQYDLAILIEKNRLAAVES